MKPTSTKISNWIITATSLFLTTGCLQIVTPTGDASTSNGSTARCESGTTNSPALAANILSGLEAWSSAGVKITGSMSNRGALDASTSLPGSGYYDGTVSHLPPATLIASGTSVLGVNGSLAADPYGFTVGSTSGTSVSFTWSYDRGDAIGYTVERCDGVACQSTFTTASSTSTSTPSYTDSGLTAGHEYRYRVRAIRSSDTSGWLVGPELVTFDGAATATNTDAFSTQLNWTPVSSAALYSIYQVTSGIPTFIGSASASSGSYRVTGLSRSSSYQFRVRMLDVNGVTDPNTVDRAVSTTGSFLASDIPGLQVWLAADAISGLNDGDPVATWSDLSGNTHDATQATSAKQPVYKAAQVNGLPSIQFDGTTYLLGNSTSSSLPGITVFAVARFMQLNCWGSLFGLGDAGNGGPNYLRYGAFGCTQPAFTRAGAENFVTAGAGISASHQIYRTSRATSGAVAVGYNGTTTTGSDTTNPGTALSLPYYVVGGEVIASFDGYAGGMNPEQVAEFLVYNSVLNAADTKSVECYLSAKYGITLSYSCP